MYKEDHMKIFHLKVIHFCCHLLSLLLIYMHFPDYLDYLQSTQKKQIINREDMVTYFHFDANDVQITFLETMEYHKAVFLPEHGRKYAWLRKY